MVLKDKCAIVTGAGRGMGRSISLRFIEEGARVAVTDINLDWAQAVVKEIKDKGGEAIAIKCDVTNMEEVNGMVKQVLDNFGRVDILVNNAGWDQPGFFIQSKPETWEKVIAINFKGPIYCTRAVLDDMIQRKAGKIISISSDAGKVGSSWEVVYSGCKGGLIAFSKALAREVAQYNINVNVVCPGPTETPMLLEGMKQSSFGQKMVDALVKAIPFRRLAKPEEIASCVAFLASNEADYITGQAISVSGGMTMV